MCYTNKIIIMLGWVGQNKLLSFVNNVDSFSSLIECYLIISDTDNARSAVYVMFFLRCNFILQPKKTF